ncbi:hypothetical protein H2199_005656 [Coniosporium tulheliwenetii]|uniref:Uncharacterized protein n=1 Tax=Coniosporium tulheliwenetii TaxID=3383036 RepID=A0ACC2Z183_9PEZI|nr:hypothetical protein H2199_005656 [Cladosporium sp. JES 115]
MARSTTSSSTPDVASFARSANERDKPRGGARTERGSRKSRSPGLFVSDAISVQEEEAEEHADERAEEHAEEQGLPTDTKRTLVAVEVSPVSNPEEYVRFEGDTVVEKVLREVEGTGDLVYKVRFQDGHDEEVPFEGLLSLDNGPTALDAYNRNPNTSETEAEDEIMVGQLRSNRRTTRDANFVDPVSFVISSSNEDDADEDDVIGMFKTRKTRGSRLRSNGTASRSSRSRTNAMSADVSSGDDSSESSARRSSKRVRKARDNGRTTRSSGAAVYQRLSYKNENIEEFEDESEDEDDIPMLQSDVFPNSRKRKRRSRNGQTIILRGPRSDNAARAGTRKSDRTTRHQNNMEEVGQDDIYRSESEPEPSKPKVVSTREVFKQLPRTDEFRNRHSQHCDTCGQGNNAGPLIYCQGCILAYHKNCIGHRTGREHLVTKVGDEDFVLQCRRCVNIAQKRDSTAPNQAKCQDCNETGASCFPFRERKTPLQEQKERDENDGADPITPVNPDLINNVDNVLFRCMTCWRAFHFHHLPSRAAHMMDIDYDDEERAQYRFSEYCRDWKCKDCLNMPAKVSGLIAWRPGDVESYTAGTPVDAMNQDDIYYLIKWENLSYFRAAWMPGAWTWGVTAPAMRKAFAKKNPPPKMRTEDAIPEEFLRIDIVLDVKYTSFVDISTIEIDMARIKEVDEALIKYKGLGYEDAVWEKVPAPEDGERWSDFETAYTDWVKGRYIRIPKGGRINARVEKARSQPFTKLEKKKQPESVVGGELMDYQLEGLNWLYYQWYSKKNGILADEMGLGKTIQIIAFLATMVSDQNCWPFLIVVPNSTVANWRREIKLWAPALRVVTYFGSAVARDLAYRYEMYPNKSKDLRCHVVVTSYDAAADDSCRKFFKGVPWQGLIVDEGQRLKSDKSLLYNALNALKIPFRILLTGTPLQNNTRELFNLLQFLDDSINASALEEEYLEMTKENIQKLHDLIRPFILRRTKAQVLGFLPPMAQIIVPVSMSVLQKKLYKSILAKSPELLRALFSSNSKLRPQERANLNNILMQLRKCLCHPFVYSREIEERTDIAAVSHRNLVEASSKLQLLELLLPKLQERGHRVLIFSQFLDMLDIVEDFLDGLEMRYQRLDGTMGSLEKQKRIDEFNAPESPLFAFLLSTRAGGVGINLATADTVIILDPDFNPHQDIQALSRAHRIGQRKKVLCFQLMTRASVEEKIVQIGRKKMALDHVVVESLDAEDIEEKDVESVLRHGAAELFAEDNPDLEIKYDSASVDKLLDRSQIENTKAGDDKSAESQFSFARVWENDTGDLADSLPGSEDEREVDPSAWEWILQERERRAAAEAAARQQEMGRGKRARMAVDYATNEHPEAPGEAVPDAADSIEDVPISLPKLSKKGRRSADDSDTDFQAGDTEPEAEASGDEGEPVDPKELALEPTQKPGGIVGGIAGSQQPKPTTPVKTKPAPFKRVIVPTLPPQHQPLDPRNPNAQQPPFRGPPCRACSLPHPRGACPLKVAGTEHCNLCGLAHFGKARSCPHIKSETQVREMLEALKWSQEPRDLVEAAIKYLKGVKGHLVQEKKREREMKEGREVPGISGVGCGGVGGCGEVQ